MFTVENQITFSSNFNRLFGGSFGNTPNQFANSANQFPSIQQPTGFASNLGSTSNRGFDAIRGGGFGGGNQGGNNGGGFSLNWGSGGGYGGNSGGPSWGGASSMSNMGGPGPSFGGNMGGPGPSYGNNSFGGGNNGGYGGKT